MAANPAVPGHKETNAPSLVHEELFYGLPPDWQDLYILLPTLTHFLDLLFVSSFKSCKSVLN
jgi:hypothetical protein